MMRKIYFRLVRALKDQKGVTLVEYSVLLTLVAAIAVSTISAMGGDIASIFTVVHDTLTSACTAAGGATCK
jgi:Flp pilus assembly pilin Flp